MRGFVDRMKAMEGNDGVLSISIGHGFYLGDVPELGAHPCRHGPGQGKG